MPPMMVSARLVHAESGRRVVEVRACEGDRLLGSALGEAADAETAEDRARQRLLERLLPAALPPGPAVTSGTTAASGAAPKPSGASPAVTGSDHPGTRPERPGGTPPATSVDSSASDSAGRSMRSASERQPIKPHHRVLSDDPGPGQSQHSRMTSAASDEGHVADQSGAGQASGAESLPASGLDGYGAHDRTAGDEPSLGSGLEARHDQPIGAVARPLATLEEPPTDPEDWSSDLAALELHLRRLGWDREQEALYLQRAFGHPSRNRLTNYGDLRAYLNALDHLAAGSDPAISAVPLRRSDLLQQCDALLALLGWNADQGRALLERELQAASRQQLNDLQLLQFNMLLESEILKRDQLVPSPDQITVVP